MEITTLHAQLALDEAQFASVRDARGARIVCLSGSVWITQDFDPRDIVLGPGDAFTIDRAGLVLINASDASRIELRSRESPTGILAGARALLSGVSSGVVSGVASDATAPVMQ